MSVGIPAISASLPIGRSRRSRTSFTANGEMSIPTHWRFANSAAATVVPHPQKGSRMMSPGLELASMMRVSSATGFCVG